MPSNEPPRILPLTAADSERVWQAARLLVLGFAENWPNAWPTMDGAMEEMREALGEDRLARIAVDEAGDLVGWVGGIRQYEGHTWELHPLVVHPEHQGRGIGTLLLREFERLIAARGASTIWLGSDDENGMTSLAGIDLYPDVLEHLAGLRDLEGHPFGFYRARGYSVVGVIPDANGAGKPDILMAKRVGD